MKRSLLIWVAFSGAIVSPAPARNIDTPWAGCAPMAISEDRTKAYSDEDLKKVECYFAGGSIPAGLEIAHHYQVMSPPDYKKARKLLIDLAKGTRSEGSSLEARGGTGGRQYSGAHINADGSISEILYRDPSPAAQRELAKMMLLGQGDTRDDDGADDWLKKAIKGGDVEARVLREALVKKGIFKK
jgi:hypothetical protein